MLKCAMCHLEISGTQYKTKGKKRYHSECYELLINKAEESNQRKAVSLKGNEKDSLTQYICLLYGIDEIPYTIDKQIEDFVDKLKYTYTGIQRTLYYFYELQGNKVGEHRKTIGIVPYCYDEAKVFFETAYEASKANADFAEENKTVHVKVKPKDRRIPYIIDINSL